MPYSFYVRNHLIREDYTPRFQFEISKRVPALEWAGSPGHPGMKMVS
jgi:hypothetical protein